MKARSVYSITELLAPQRVTHEVHSLSASGGGWTGHGSLRSGAVAEPTLQDPQLLPGDCFMFLKCPEGCLLDTLWVVSTSPALSLLLSKPRTSCQPSPAPCWAQEAAQGWACRRRLRAPAKCTQCTHPLWGTGSKAGALPPRAQQWAL